MSLTVLVCQVVLLWFCILSVLLVATLVLVPVLALVILPVPCFCVSFLHFGHNYNYVTRQVMYHWFNKHLKLGHQEPIIEDDYELLTTEEITVWDDEHPQPESGVEHEVKLLRSIGQTSQQQISKLVNTAEDPVAKVREIVGTAIGAIVMRDLPAAGEVEGEKVGETDHASYLESRYIFRHKAAGEELPAVVFYPNTVEWNGTMILWIDGQGKAGMVGENGKPNKAIAAALGKGSAVVGIDMLYQGEFLTAGETSDAQRSAPTTNRQVPAFTFAYNHTLFAHRVHDVLSLISYMRTDRRSKKEMKLILVGTGGAGPIAATAGAIAGDAVQQAIIDTQGFRFASITSYLDPNFFPGAIKYGDLPAILALNVPRPLVLIGEETVPRKTGYLYSRMGKQVRLAGGVRIILQISDGAAHHGRAFLHFMRSSLRFTFLKSCFANLKAGNAYIWSCCCSSAASSSA